MVNCAAWTAVDDAEKQEAAAFAVNAVAPGLLARACAGTAPGSCTSAPTTSSTAPPPRRTTRTTRVAPRSAYGRTKARRRVGRAAPRHRQALVVRTAWLYGAHGPCFPRTIARAARERGSLEVVDDQVGQPTWTRDVAELVLAPRRRAGPPAGTYHATSSGQTSWFEFAQAVVETAGLVPDDRQSERLVGVRATGSATGVLVLGHRRLHDAGVDPIGAWGERWAAAGELSRWRARAGRAGTARTPT